ncbi:Beta-lactamase hydrolase-like protein [Thalassovita gelatinovora]|uniref:Beta-lactamase hydrolase-like protein n=1 Tax=Thalassovita gelatinovora TaxID=53501 RepID=A0A0P1FHB9_THAGE|nr:TIGR01244 family sulfur transferase [Thalassovita gelatinovora]QIZ79895.1 TIGR01244 family phosphatase [Thalassovita gelatinovora]CUH67012.1 Beta-lactamase hydrolase-like protein [Thalassovita gelatinovora]SEQ46997.1 TIGR01244 family protein [Thalassovita gelatinovora]
MDIRQITPRYAVSPQISVEDLPAIKAAGFVGVICNRPDEEVPPSHHAATIEAATIEQGLSFAALPLTHQTMTPENIAKQANLADTAEGPVLAYCASGTRSTVIWALGQAGKQSADDILLAAAKAGYMLDQLRPQLEG